MRTARFYPEDGPPAISLRPREAAAALGISLSHLERLTKAGDIPAAKVGRCTLYPVKGLTQWLDAQTQGGRHDTH